MDQYDSSRAADFDRLLEQRERQLCAVLGAFDAGDEEPSRAAQHEVTDFKEMAEDEARRRLGDAQAERAAHELEQVLAARRRLHEGRYGICTSCGEPIDLRRLTALPWTQLCTPCQVREERAHGGRA